MWRRVGMGGERGQVLLLMVVGLAAVLVGGFVLGAVARGMGAHDAAQRAADLGALAGARAMYAAYPRLFEPDALDGAPNPRHLHKATYVALTHAAAARVAAANGGGPEGRGDVPGRRDVRASARARAGATARRGGAGRATRRRRWPRRSWRRPARVGSRTGAATTARWRIRQGGPDAARRGAGVRSHGGRRPHRRTGADDH